MPLSSAYTSLPLGRRRDPFDSPDWIFELKYDGFRALACIEDGRCTLVSRNGNAFAGFAGLAESISAAIPVQHAVLDGEIVCLDAEGKPQFEDLLFRRGEPTFVAFDLLARDGADLRLDALVDRKRALRRLLAAVPAAPVLYADHVEGSGIALFEQVCEVDLEGIVAKQKFSPYRLERDRSPWVKIRNRNYSQWEGRGELFERDRHREPVAGWHACELECSA